MALPRLRLPRRPPTLRIPGRRKPPTHWESELQQAMMQWVHRCVPETQAIIYHTPNGGRRSKREAGILKAMGVRAGVPDLAIILPAPMLMAWAEVKLEKTAWHDRTGLSDDERKFRDQVLALGHRYAVVRTLGELYDFLVSLGVQPRSRPIDPVTHHHQQASAQGAPA